MFVKYKRLGRERVYIKAKGDITLLK